MEPAATDVTLLLKRYSRGQQALAELIPQIYEARRLASSTYGESPTTHYKQRICTKLSFGW